MIIEIIEGDGSGYGWGSEFTIRDELGGLGSNDGTGYGFGFADGSAHDMDVNNLLIL